MLVQCTKCRSKFKFPDSELTGEGVWLKCGSCKNVFFLGNPDFVPLKAETVTSGDGLAERGEAPPDIDNLDSHFEESKIMEGFDELAAEGEAARSEPGGRGKLVSALKAAGGVIAVLLVVSGIYYYFFPDVTERLLRRAAPYIPFSKQLGLAGPEAPIPAPSIDFLNVKETFVKNWVLGDIMVIQGVAVNKMDGPASQLKIRAKLLDPSGQFIAEASSYAGAVFSEDELMNLTEQEIMGKLSKPEGAEFPNRDIAPEASIPFSVIFIKPPARASEYIVELESMEGLNRN